MKPVLTLLTAASVLAGSALAGTITTNAFDSPTLGRTWAFNVYLPDGYEGSNLEYAVIYLLHGTGGNEASWDEGMNVIDDLVTSGAIPPVIAVAPASGRSWWVDTIEPFETAFVEDLIPHVDATFRTIEDRAGRAVVGLSMGGYGALRYALVHSEVFRAATLLSPALYAEQPPLGSSARSTGAFGTPYEPDLWDERNYPAALEGYLARGLEVPVFIGVGDDDWNEPEGWVYNVDYQAALLFQRLNKEAGSAAELRVIDGGHDWDAWKPLLVEALPYLTRYLRFPRPSQ